MKPMWTPWRMSYILAIRSGAGCVFCDDVLAGGADPGLIIHRGSRAFVILNLYPYATGHLMVVPYRHAASLHELDAAELEEISDLVRTAEGVVERTLQARIQHVGINVGRCAGAGVEGHLHVHLVPDPGPPEGASGYGGGATPEPLEVTRRRLAESWATATADAGVQNGNS